MKSNKDVERYDQNSWNPVLKSDDTKKRRLRPFVDMQPPDAIQTYQADKRIFAIVPVPDIELRYGYPSSMAMFYRSTGTSNYNADFATVYFPSHGVLEKGSYMPPGWIQKFGGYFKPELVPWINAFCKRFDEFWMADTVAATDEKEQDNCKNRYHGLLNKFSYWWQLQVSAQLGGEFWERPDVAYLRGVALTYDWDRAIQDFVERDHILPYLNTLSPTIVPQEPELRFGDFISFDELRGIRAKNAVTLNAAFRQHDAVLEYPNDYLMNVYEPRLHRELVL